MNPADRTMPVIDAYPVPALRGDHYRAVFPDGEVTYPSRESMKRAGLRVGAAIRFHSDPVPGPRTTTQRGLASSSPAHGRRGSVAADPPFGAGAAPSGGREAGASDQTG